MTDIFITGVTGFLGRHLAARLLRRPDRPMLYCLVRCDDADHGKERLLRSVGRVVDDEELAALSPRLVAVPGDLTRERLGMTEAQWEFCASFCSVVLHSAADVRFNQDLEDARDRNVQGTRRVAELAVEAQRRGVLKRFDWVGTAFVAGLRRDLVFEDELTHDSGWKNAYEQSKYEAEQWLHAECGDLPVTIFRPSIIVGESNTGATSNFGMLYWPLQIYARGWWRTVVGRRETPVDLVPVDFVADAIEALSREGMPVGGPYHLTAGPQGSLTIDQIASLAREYFGGKDARYVEPEIFMRWVRPVADLLVWGPKRRVIRSGGRFFIPYFSGNPLFDNRRTREALKGSGVRVPDVRDYFQVLLDYASTTNFGRTERQAA